MIFVSSLNTFSFCFLKFVSNLFLAGENVFSKVTFFLFLKFFENKIHDGLKKKSFKTSF